MKAFYKIFIGSFLVVSLMGIQQVHSQTQTHLISTPYGSGGFEGNSIDSVLLFSPGVASKLWKKSASSTSFTFSTITSTDTVRSGSKALKAKINLTGTRIIYSPQTYIKPSVDSVVTFQYFQRGFGVNITPFVKLYSGNSNGSLSLVNSPGTWQKMHYTTTEKVTSSGAAISFYGAFNIQRSGSTAGEYYLDDACIYSGAYDVTPPNNVTTPTTADVPAPYSSSSNRTNSVVISWTAPTGGVDGGGYMVVAYESSPFSDNSPNQNGVYAVNSVITNGTANLRGTVIGMNFGSAAVTPLSTTLTYNSLKAGTKYWFKVYAFDKAFNYSSGVATTPFTTQGITHFYNKLNKPLNLLASWDKTLNGTANPPTSFTANYQLFHIVKNDSLTANWTFGGIVSNIVVGDTVNLVRFTIPAGRKILSPTSPTPTYFSTIDVVNNGTLVIKEPTATTTLSSGYMTFGNVDKGTVEYASTGNQPVNAGLEYGNLVLNGGGTKIPASDFVVKGNLTIKSKVKVTAGFAFYVDGNSQVDATPPSADPDDPLYFSAGNIMNYTGTGIHTITDNGWGPTIFKDMGIMDGSTILLNSNLSVYGDLYIEKGTISLGTKHLTLNGAFTGSAAGNLTGSKSANITLKNFYSGMLFFNQAVVGGNYLNSLTTDNDVTLGNKLQIAPSTIADGSTTGFIRVAGGKLFTNDSLVLTSDATGTARIAESDGDYIEGKVTMQQYFPKRRAWRLITAPVDKATNLTINQAWQNGKVYNSTTSANYTYDEGTGTWNPTPVVVAPHVGTHITKGTDTPADTLPGSVMSAGFDLGVKTLHAASSIRIFDGSGFTKTIADGPGSTGIADYPAYMLFVRGDRNINLTNVDTFSSTTLEYTSAIGKEDQFINSPLTSNKPSLFGNPYPSPIDFEKVQGGNGSLQDKFYIWDSRLGSFGAYRLVERPLPASDYESLPNDVTIADSSLPDPRYIQSGQGFFVMPATNSTGIQMQESFKSDFIRPQVFGRALPKMYISMYQRFANDSVNLADGVMACFDESFASAIDNRDAPKFANFNENFFLRRNGKRLSLEARSEIKANDTLFFGFTNMDVKNYQFKMKAANFGGNSLSAYLVDKFLNKTTPLGLDGAITSVNFSITSNAASKNDARFMIIFKPNTILPVTLTSVKAYKKNSDIEVEWLVSNETDVNYYEVEKSLDGAVFASSSNVKARNNRNGNEQYVWLDTRPVDGYNYYRIKTTDKSGEIKYSAVVRVLIGKNNKSDITFFPNPVTGRQISLQLNNMEKGVYTIEMFNQLGQKVYNRTFVHSGGTASQSLALNDQLPKGVYNMKISGAVSRQFKVVVQ